MRLVRHTWLVVGCVLLALVLGTGCSKEERLSKGEFERAYPEAVRPRLIASTAAIPIVLGKQPYTVTRGQAVMARQATTNHAVADTLDDLNPPSDAESAVADMVRALRDQAVSDQRAADNPRLTEDEFRDAICCTSPPIAAAENDLAKLGYTPVEIGE